ncbi:MAG: AsmA family protein [Alphaproteobacteria bacterium]|nr:AsmA family protein [Alphaproteobacteria bacterium]
MADLSNSDTKPARKNTAVAALRLGAYLTAGLIGVIVVIGLATYIAPPGWLARDYLIRVVKEKTGRDLTVGGEARLLLRPDIRLRLDEVALSGPPDKAGARPFTADGVDISIQILDLWNWQFEVREVAFDRPHLQLRSGEPLLVRIGDGEVKAGGIPQKMIFSNGTITIEGAPSVQTVSLDDVTGEVVRNGEGNGISFKGQLKAQGDPISVDGSVGDVFALADGASSQIAFKFDADYLQATLDGQLATQPVGQFKGWVNAKSEKLDRLLEVSQVDAAGANLGRTVALEGKVTSSLRRMSLSPAKLTLDAMSGIVVGTVSIEEDRPEIKARVTSGKLDLDALLPATAKQAAFSLEPLERHATIPTPWDSLVASLKRATSPRRSFQQAAITTPDGWSTEPFKLTEFPDLDVAVSMQADEIKFKKLPLKNGQLELTSNPGRLEVLLRKVDLDKGSVSGRVDLTLADGPLQSGVRLKLERLSLDAFVSQLLEQRLLTGVGDIDMTVSGSGRSMRELVGSLDGSATMAAERGAIIGYDLRRAILSFGAAQPYDPSRTTRFDKVKASFAVRKGVLKTSEDLSLTGPEVDISSSGSVGLVSQRIDQHVQMSLKPPPLHLPIPLRVRGTLDEPAFSWDIFSAIAEPAKYATPFSVGARDEKMPTEVREAITQALSADPVESRISAEARGFLEELLRTR